MDCSPMDCSLPGSSVYGILWARILERVAIPISRGSSQPRDRTQVSTLQADSFPSEPPGKPMNAGVGSLSLLQGIFLTQKSNWGPPALQADSLPAEPPGEPHSESICRSVVSNSLRPMDCTPPGPSVHGILQARILEWVAISFSRGSSQPRNQTWVSCVAGRFLTY